MEKSNHFQFIFINIINDHYTIYASAEIASWIAYLSIFSVSGFCHLDHYNSIRLIYNMDKTGFFSVWPRKTFAFTDYSCHGGKKSKERITVAVCANMDGSDKMKLLVTGKDQNPRILLNPSNTSNHCQCRITRIAKLGCCQISSKIGCEHWTNNSNEKLGTLF